MKKNVVWWPAIVHKENAQKYGDYNYFEYTRKSWEYWCERNDVLFVPFTEPVEDDLFRFRPNWQKIIFVFDELERKNIDYDQICLVDSSCMIKWDAPNFFNEVNTNPVAFRSLENIKWIYEGVKGYSKLFNDYDFKLTEYVSCGFQIFDKSHKPFLDKVKKFYYANQVEILKLQKTVSRGTDQPVYNYLKQIHKVKFDYISPAYMVTHLNRFDWLGGNWQLKEDSTPFFVKYGYIWFFSGFDKTQRGRLMNQTWDIIKGNYEE